MGYFGFALILLSIAAIVAVFVFRSQFKSKQADRRAEYERRGATAEEIEDNLAQYEFGVPSFAIPALVVTLVLGFGLATFNSMYFYAEPGYIYHVRTIFGEEKVVSDVGFNAHTFGRFNAWKRAMTVQATAMTLEDGTDGVNNETDEDNASVHLPPLNVVFLDQVDGQTEATARFSLPTDKETFLKMAHEYRSPSNLLRTALIPAFKETLSATGSLLSAEAYFSGGRTEFNIEFENQMQNGIYLVRRTERTVSTGVVPKAAANASAGEDQGEFGDDTKVVFEVTKRTDSDGQFLRKEQSFGDFGISVVDARVTEMKPNPKFVERMQLKQKASADRAIAREQRVQEVEQRLLAIAKGEREVAEKQASALVLQIEQTTAAETTKQLALTAATQLKEAAEIDKDTAQITYEKGVIDAKRVKVAADAEAYAKKAVLTADNALQAKLDAEVKIQAQWAQAYAARNVPSQVFITGSDSGGTPTGSDTEVSAFMRLMTVDAAQRLNYDREIGTGK